MKKFQSWMGWLCVLTLWAGGASEAATFNAICTGGKVYDAGLCYDRCDPGYSGAGPVCYQDCPSGYTNDGALCRKPGASIPRGSYGRGAGSSLVCGSGKQWDAGLCYPTCAAGYTGVGPVCWQVCPGGYTDDGALCRRDAHIISADTSSCPWYDACGLTLDKGCSRCPSGYANDGCTCRRDAHVFAKSSYGRGAGLVPDACPAGHQKDGGLCYPTCAAGFTGVGPVCWQDCPSGYTNDGALCRSFEVIARSSYGRGAGTPMVECTSSSFTRSDQGLGPWGGFSMVFASDPQFPWNEEGDCTTAECVKSRSITANRQQIQAIHDIQQASGGVWPSGPGLTQGAGAPIGKPEGVIVNGDLTAFWHDWQVDLFEEHFNNANPKYAYRLKTPIFPGLGNHDYANNVNDCWWTREGAHTQYGANGCARHAVDFMKATLQCNKMPNFPASRVRDFDDKSLAYSWDMGSYHFVQLHNYPTYTASGIGISSAIPWLREDLRRATAEGRKIVLNMHDYGDHMAKDDPEFLSAIAGQRVVALFAGHLHGTNGGLSTVYNTTIPVFHSGSSDKHTFLLVRFEDAYMNVAVIDSTSGTPRFAHPQNERSLRTVVFFPPTLAPQDNIALGKPTSQSSTVYAGDASRAVDGQTDGVYNHGSVTHTDFTAQPWWMVDLQSVQPVGSVVLHNRTDCCAERLSRFRLLTSTDGVTWQENLYPGTAPREVSFKLNRQARYIKVQLDGTGALSLAEVQVSANLALGKPTSQSSTASGAAASRAVDGNTNGNYSQGSVTHTHAEKSPWPWWQVDLQGVQRIGSVVLYNRTDCCSDRLSHFALQVSDDGIAWREYPFTDMAALPMTYSVNRTARYVRVQLYPRFKDGAPTEGILSLAEVEVFAGR